MGQRCPQGTSHHEREPHPRSEDRPGGWHHPGGIAGESDKDQVPLPQGREATQDQAPEDGESQFLLQGHGKGCSEVG